MELDLTEVTFALSDALDLVAVNKAHHGKHVAFMAMECGQQLGWDREALNDLLFAAMLHDCGLSTAIAYDLKSLQQNHPQIRKHAVRGYGLLLGFAPFAPIAGVVLYHHTPWAVLMRDTIPRGSALLSNCINLASYVDDALASKPDDNILFYTKEIRNEVGALSGTVFAPELADAFLKVSEKEAFWLWRHPEHLNPRLRRHARSRTQQIELHVLKQLAQMFAKVVDSKSPFTAEHSAGVARLASYLGGLCGLSSHMVDLLEVAGYLHDLGKLKVPDAILSKPGKLDDREMAIIRCHSFDTYQILNSIRGLWQIAEIAAFHHETPAGTGYPFRIGAPLLSLEAKIVAVSDVFQALAQERPYRKALTPQEIFDILQGMAKRHQLDPELVAVVGENLEACWLTATGARQLTSPVPPRPVEIACAAPAP